MKQLMSSGVEISYIDEGSGPPVILSHCSSASHRMWRALIDELKVDYRVLALDFINYGNSSPWHGKRRFELSDEAMALLNLVDIAGSPAHFVGHSYGGAVTLEALRLSKGIARAITLIEPVSFFTLELAERKAEWQEIRTLIDEVENAVLCGELEAAAAAYMGFWIGPESWAATPDDAKANVIATIKKVNSEFQAIQSSKGQSLDHYAAITAPVLFIDGALSPGPSRAVTEILAAQFPQVRRETLENAGHLCPITHRDMVNKLIKADMTGLHEG